MKSIQYNLNEVLYTIQINEEYTIQINEEYTIQINEEYTIQINEEYHNANK